MASIVRVLSFASSVPMAVMATALLLTGCAQERAARENGPSPIGGKEAFVVPQTAINAESIQPATVKRSQDDPVQRGKPNSVAELPENFFEKPESPFAELKELSVDAVVRLVVERNPTIEKMQATAMAVQARYPQLTALDDPMFGFSTAPGSIGSPNATYAARAEVSQKIPYPGKRDLRGRMVQAEANAAVQDVADTRLQLIESALNAYADYFLNDRALRLNEENLKRTRELRQNASTRVANTQAPQQDLLQADVEVARLQERTLILQRGRQVAKARLNTLMHFAPDASLPPPQPVAARLVLPSALDLRAQALLNRPDVKALSERVSSDEAAIALAQREYKPDVELLAAYDGFWQGSEGRPLQWQIGARLNLPVRRERRSGAIIQAQSELAARRAELARLHDQIGYQIHEAYEMAQENLKVLALYEKTLVPAAEANIKEATASYVNGKVPFVSLAEAQRNFINLKDRYTEILAESLRRKAALERTVGGPLDEFK